MLKVEKLPSYLSPSSLKEFESKPNTFYLTRMAPEHLLKPREPQTELMAIGSIFDVTIKNYLLNTRSCCDVHFPDRAKVMERLLKDERDEKKKEEMAKLPFYEAFFLQSVEPQNHHLRDHGLRIAGFYVKVFALTGILFDDVEIHRNFTLFSENVSLYMKLDAQCRYKSLIPHDWKVSGFNSQASPKPGYFALIDEEGCNKGAHDSYYEGIPMEKIDEDWATQTCTYGWGMGIIPLTEFYASIHMIVMRDSGLRLAAYYGLITKEFQQSVINRYRDAWYKIKSGVFVKSLGDEGDVETGYINEKQRRY